MAEIKDITRFDTEKFLRIFSIDENFREIVVSSFLQKLWGLEGIPSKILISSLYSDEFESLQLTEQLKQTIKEKRKIFFNLVQLLLLNRRSISENSIEDFLKVLTFQRLEDGELIEEEGYKFIELKKIVTLPDGTLTEEELPVTGPGLAVPDFKAVAEFRDAISETLGVPFLPKKVFKQILYTFKYSTLKKFFGENWKKFLPEFDVLNMENSEQIMVFQDSLMKEFDRLASTIDEIYDVADIDKIPSQYLSYLAQTIGYEREDENFLFDASFRELIKNIIEVYRIKGTNFSFELFFNFLGFEVTLREFWFDQRFTDPNVVVNPFTFVSDRNNFGFYLAPIKPTDYVPAGLLNPRAITDEDIIDTQDANFFNRFVGDLYTPSQVLGNEGVFPDIFAERFGVQKTYTFFKTNIIEISLSRIGAQEVVADIGEEGAPDDDDSLIAGLTFEEIQIIQLYANFLTPLYLSRNIVVSIEPFRQEATSLVPTDDDRIGEDFPDFPEVPELLKRQIQFNTYVGLQPSFFYWDGGRQSLNQTRAQFLQYQQNLDLNLKRRFYADPTTSKIEGGKVENRFDLRGEKVNYIFPWDSQYEYKIGDLALAEGSLVICIEDYNSDDTGKPLFETINKWQRWPLTGIEPGGLFINGFANNTYMDIFNPSNPQSVYSQVKEDLDLSNDDPYLDEKVLREISKFSQTRRVSFTGNFTENSNEVIIQSGNVSNIKKGFKLEQVKRKINLTVNVTQASNEAIVTSGEISDLKIGDVISFTRKNFNELKGRFDFNNPSLNLSNLDFSEITNEFDPEDLTLTNSRVVLVNCVIEDINEQENKITLSNAALQSASNLNIQVYRIVMQRAVVSEIDGNIIKLKNSVAFDTQTQEQIKENENALHTEENLEFFVVGNILNAYKINGKSINPRDFIFPIVDGVREFTNPIKTNNIHSFFGKGTQLNFHTNKVKTETGRINVSLSEESNIATFVSGNFSRLFQIKQRTPVFISKVNGVIKACEVVSVDLQNFEITLSEAATSSISSITLLYNFEESNIKSYRNNLNKFSYSEDPNTPNSIFNRAVIKQVISENSDGDSEIVISDPLARFNEFKEYDNFRKIEVFAKFEENSYEVEILPTSFFNTRDIELSGEFFNTNEIVLNSSFDDELEKLEYELRTKELRVLEVKQNNAIILQESKVFKIDLNTRTITVDKTAFSIEPTTISFNLRIVSKNISLMKPGFQILPKNQLIERAEIIKVDFFNNKIILNKPANQTKSKEKVTFVRKEFEDRFVGTFIYGKKRVTNIGLSDSFEFEEYPDLQNPKVFKPGDIVTQTPTNQEIKERFICIKEHNSGAFGLSILTNPNFERFNPFDYLEKGMKIKNPSDLFEYEIKKINNNESYTFKGLFTEGSSILEIIEDSETIGTSKILKELDESVKYRFSATTLTSSFEKPNKLIKSFTNKPEYRLFYENASESEDGFYNFYMVYSEWKGLGKGSRKGPLEASDFNGFIITSAGQDFVINGAVDFGEENLGEEKGNFILLWGTDSTGKPQIENQILESDKITEELNWIGPRNSGRKFFETPGVIVFETEITFREGAEFEKPESPIFFQLDSYTPSFELNKTFGNFEENEFLEDFSVLDSRIEKRLRFTTYRENFNFVQIKGTNSTDGVSFDGIYNVKRLEYDGSNKKLILNSKIDYDQNVPSGFVWIYKPKRKMQERIPFLYNEIDSKKEQFGLSQSTLESKSTNLFLEDKKYFSTKFTVLENSLGTDLNGQYFTIDTRKNNINYFYFTTQTGQNDPDPQFIQSIFEKTQSINFEKRVGGLGFPIFIKEFEYRFLENYDESTNTFLYFLVSADWNGTEGINNSIDVTTSDINETIVYIENQKFILESSLDFGEQFLNQPAGNVFLLWSDNPISKPAFATEPTVSHEILLQEVDDEETIAQKLHDYIFQNLQNIFIPSYRKYSSTVLIRNKDYGVVRNTRTEGNNINIENIINKRNFNVADFLIETFGRFSVGSERIVVESNNFDKILKEYRNSHKLVIGPIYEKEKLIIDESEVIDLIEKRKVISENGVLLSERSDESIIIVSNPAFVDDLIAKNLILENITLEKPELI
jgi:hypothetical protein